MAQSQGGQIVFSQSLGRFVEVRPGEPIDAAITRAAVGQTTAPNRVPDLSADRPATRPIGPTAVGGRGGGPGPLSRPTNPSPNPRLSPAGPTATTEFVDPALNEQRFRENLSQSDDNSVLDPYAKGKKAIGLAADALALGSSFIPGSLPARMLGTGVAGAIQGAVTPGANPVVGAASQAGLEFLGDKLAKGIPRLGNRLGLRLGGVRGNIDEVVDAMSRERARLGAGHILGADFHRPGQGLSLGDDEHIRKLIQEMSQKRTAEAATKTGTYPISSLRGATKAASKEAELGTRGIKTVEALGSAEDEAIREMGALTRVANAGGSYTDASDPLRKLVKSLRDETTNPNIVAYREATPVTATRGLKMQETFGHGARPLFKKRQLHESVKPEEMLDEYLNEGLYKTNKDELLKVFPELAGHNARLTDLFTINEANSHIRGKGSLLGTPGEMGARGGLGAGLAQNVAALSGGGGSPLLRAVGAPLTILGASARGASALGNTFGSIAKATPISARFADLISDSSDFKDLFDPEKKPKKRKPGER